MQEIIDKYMAIVKASPSMTNETKVEIGRHIEKFVAFVDSEHKAILDAKTKSASKIQKPEQQSEDWY